MQLECAACRTVVRRSRGLTRYDFLGGCVVRRVQKPLSQFLPHRTTCLPRSECFANNELSILHNECHSAAVKLVESIIAFEAIT